MANVVVSNTTPNGKLIESDGMATRSMLKWMQNVGSTVNQGFDQDGNYQGPIGTHATIAGRSTLASIVENIGTDGIVQAAGIDFAIPYANKNTDHIADGSGSPLAGGRAAEVALVSSAPAVEPHKWVDGMVGGVFTKSQPDFTDLSGSAGAAQVPVLSSLNGQIALTQLPPEGISVTVTQAKLTPGGTQGSLTFTDGLLTAQVQAT